MQYCVLFSGHDTRGAVCRKADGRCVGECVVLPFVVLMVYYVAIVVVLINVMLNLEYC